MSKQKKKKKKGDKVTQKEYILHDEIFCKKINDKFKYT